MDSLYMLQALKAVEDSTDQDIGVHRLRDVALESEVGRPLLVGPGPSRAACSLDASRLGVDLGESEVLDAREKVLPRYVRILGVDEVERRGGSMRC